MKNSAILRLFSLVSAIMLACPALVRAAEANPAPKSLTETPEQRAARMKWFIEARFGMFIHWGVYSVPAGEWKDKTNHGEWIMETGKIPVSTYETFADQFNPVKFDAKEWVRMAKDAGMKYIVITSKHHDGFGLWDSKLTDWDIGRTPFKRDPLKELADACADAGITFCLYHSIMDWHHPDWGTRRAWNDRATGRPDMDRYTDYMKGQLKELLTGYGPIGILWFDGEWESPWTHERGADLYDFCRRLQPNTIINNRVGKGRAGMSGMDKGQGLGDYGTPEQEIPPTGFGPGVAWESCMTMNGHWGYNKNDQNWKSSQALVRNLIDCASKGGNYLLNVGPTSEGLFPSASIIRLAEIGKWMRVNGDTIYGSTASPFRKLAWGRCTQKADGPDTVLYLHVFDWPKDGTLLVTGLKNEAKSAALFVGGQKLSTKPTPAGLEVEVPKAAPDAISTTIALRVAGRPEVEAFRILPGKDGSLLLDPANAELSGKHLGLETMAGKENLGFWTDADDQAQWPIEITQAGEYTITAELSGEAAGGFTVAVDGQELVAKSPATGAYSKYAVDTLGSLKLSVGRHTLTVRPVAANWKPMNLRWLKLAPAAK